MERKEMYSVEMQRTLQITINDIERFKLKYQHIAFLGKREPEYPNITYCFQSINHIANFI